MRPVPSARTVQILRLFAGLPGPTIKAALFAGLALICVTWLFAGYLFTRRVSDLQHRAVDINQRYTHGQELLTVVRSQVLVGSVYVRDALLEPSSANADGYRARLEEAYRAADAALRAYVPVNDSPDERTRVDRLRADLSEFRQTLLDVLGTDSRRWPAEAGTLLRRQIMPKRESALRVTDEVQALNRSAFVQRQNEIASVYRATHRELWGSFGAAVLVSLAIAALAAVYVGRLEKREKDNTRDLQRLSARLLTAQEEERRLIARELHDEVGQALTAIKVELAVAQRATVAGAGQSSPLDNAKNIAESTLHMVRDLSRLLHPAVLDDLGLSAALESLVSSFGKRHALHVEFVDKGIETRLDRSTETAAYRIVQEALTNVAKHAQAQTCRIFLERLPQQVRIIVEDDGVGFYAPSPDGIHTNGLGLIGIRERITQLGGTLRVDTAPSSGTRMVVELPVHADPISPAKAQRNKVAALGIHEVLGG